MFKFSLFCFLFVIMLTTTIVAQENELRLKTPPNLEEVLARKIDLDKKSLAKNQYTIQIYSGNYDMAKVFLDSFAQAFPDQTVKLKFETPNYKIRVGQFSSRLEGVEIFNTIKDKFPQAFMLKP